MSDSTQFNSAPSPLPSTDAPDEFSLLEFRPPEETRQYVLDISWDLHSADPERQADGLRRLCIEALERGCIDFPAAGDVAYMRDEVGPLAAVVDLCLFLVFPDLWLPEGRPRDPRQPVTGR